MTQQDKQHIKREIDRRAREQQAWWDECEAFCQPSDPAIDQIDAAAQVFDSQSRELMLDANLGMAIAAHNLEERSAS